MDGKQTIRFIINPYSGRGKKRPGKDMICKILDPEKFQVEICYTKSAGHATTLSREAAANGTNIVCIAGGDGSVNEAATGLIGTQTSLAIIPMGSGNGLARHLKIPSNVVKAIDLINTGIAKTIDTATINGQPFCGVAGTGFDSHIAQLFSTYGKRGFWSYFKLVLNEIFNYKPLPYLIRVDNHQKRTEALLITIANSSQYGNNALIAPNAVIDDGLLDLCIIKKIPRVYIPVLLFKLFRGTLKNSLFVEFRTGKNFKITCEKPGYVHVDGEPLHMEKELNIAIKPKSLNVICPG